MQLRPVFLLAPEPERRPTRRHLLFGIGAFATGAAAGIGLHTLAGGARPVTAGPVSPEDRRNLDWARALASGPADALFDSAGGYLVEVGHFPDDAVLWRGAHRLAQYVIAHAGHERAPRIAGIVVALLRRFPASGGVDFADLLPEFERVRRR
jgi:hypothetical protein